MMDIELEMHYIRKLKFFFNSVKTHWNTAWDLLYMIDDFSSQHHTAEFNEE
jgi:hypothetical protein